MNIERNDKALDMAIDALKKIRDGSQELWVAKYAAQVGDVLVQRREFNRIMDRAIPQLTVDEMVEAVRGDKNSNPR